MSIVFAPFLATSSAVVTVGPPNPENAEALEADPEQALQDVAAEVVGRGTLPFDSSSQRVTELPSGQPAVVLDMTPGAGVAGGRGLITYGSRAVYVLVLQFGTGATGFQDEADDVIESCRLLPATHAFAVAADGGGR